MVFIVRFDDNRMISPVVRGVPHLSTETRHFCPCCAVMPLSSRLRPCGRVLLETPIKSPSLRRGAVRGIPGAVGASLPVHNRKGGFPPPVLIVFIQLSPPVAFGVPCAFPRLRPSCRQFRLMYTGRRGNVPIAVCPCSFCSCKQSLPRPLHHQIEDCFLWPVRVLPADFPRCYTSFPSVTYAISVRA